MIILISTKYTNVVIIIWLSNLKWNIKKIFCPKVQNIKGHICWTISTRKKKTPAPNFKLSNIFFLIFFGGGAGGRVHTLPPPPPPPHAPIHGKLFCWWKRKGQEVQLLWVTCCSLWMTSCNTKLTKQWLMRVSHHFPALISLPILCWLHRVLNRNTCNWEWRTLTVKTLLVLCGSGSSLAVRPTSPPPPPPGCTCS